MTEPDYIVVGSGINGLVCAATLGRRGKTVVLVERNDRIGGCLRSDELIEPGFKHDVLATWFPLFITSPAYAELQEELAAHGVTFDTTNKPTAAVLPDNSAFVLSCDREQNIATMNARYSGDGDAYASALAFVEATAGLSFGLLSQQLRRPGIARLLVRSLWKHGVDGLISYFGSALCSCRTWLHSSIQDPAARACLAAWVLHVGLTPESSLSGHFAKIVAFTLEQTGMPVVRGGNQALLDAFAKIIAAHGGTIMTSADIDGILTSRDRAVGVILADGSTLRAREGIVCSVTPTQLYGRLLREVKLPKTVRDSAQRFRYGLGNLQIHLALNEHPDWINDELSDVALVHVTDGLDGISRATSEGTRGKLPSASTIAVGQPHVVDPSRAPPGGAILWIQILDVPRYFEGEAAAAIHSDESDRQWTPRIREDFADRIIDRLRRHIRNLDSATIGRKVLSPADLERLNINLVGGDPYGGFCGLEQSFLWRPGTGSRNYNTPVKSLYHIGASTHPGPGLGGVSGYLMAVQLS